MAKPSASVGRARAGKCGMGVNEIASAIGRRVEHAHTSQLADSSIRTKSGKKTPTSSAPTRAPRAGRVPGTPCHPPVRLPASIRRRLHSLEQRRALPPGHFRAGGSLSVRPADGSSWRQTRVLAPRHAVSASARFGAIASCAQRVPLVGWRRFASTRWSIFSARSTASSYSSMRYTGAGRAQVIGMRAPCQRITRLRKGRVETGTAPGHRIRTLRSARVQCMYAPRN